MDSTPLKKLLLNHDPEFWGLLKTPHPADA
jgi:hypothetical protein